MMDDMQVATASMPLYATLPALTEAVVERGWTRVYSRIGDMGVGWYLGYFVLYMASVEFFVYWMHRGLHDVRIGYRCLKLSSNRSSWRGPAAASTGMATVKCWYILVSTIRNHCWGSTAGCLVQWPWLAESRYCIFSAVGPEAARIASKRCAVQAAAPHPP